MPTRPRRPLSGCWAAKGSSDEIDELVLLQDSVNASMEIERVRRVVGGRESLAHDDDVAREAGSRKFKF